MNQYNLIETEIQGLQLLLKDERYSSNQLVEVEKEIERLKSRQKNYDKGIEKNE